MRFVTSIILLENYLSFGIFEMEKINGNESGLRHTNLSITNCKSRTVLSMKFFFFFNVRKTQFSFFLKHIYIFAHKVLYRMQFIESMQFVFSVDLLK